MCIVCVYIYIYVRVSISVIISSPSLIWSFNIIYIIPPHVYIRIIYTLGPQNPGKNEGLLTPNIWVITLKMKVVGSHVAVYINILCILVSYLARFCTSSGRNLPVGTSRIPPKKRSGSVQNSAMARSSGGFTAKRWKRPKRRTFFWLEEIVG